MLRFTNTIDIALDSRLRADRYTERSFVPAFQAFCATVRAKALWKSPANVAEQKICATISAFAGMTVSSLSTYVNFDTPRFLRPA